MSLTRTTVAALATCALAATSFSLVAAGPAHADGPEKSQEFRFAGTEVDFSVEKHKKFHIDVDLDDAAPRSRWRLVLRHDGKVVHDRTYTANREGEVEFTTYRRNTAGKDTFKLTVRKVGGPKRYSTIVMR